MVHHRRFQGYLKLQTVRSDKKVGFTLVFKNKFVNAYLCMVYCIVIHVRFSDEPKCCHKSNATKIEVQNT